MAALSVDLLDRSQLVAAESLSVLKVSGSYCIHKGPTGNQAFDSIWFIQPLDSITNHFTLCICGIKVLPGTNHLTRFGFFRRSVHRSIRPEARCGQGTQCIMTRSYLLQTSER